MINKNKFHNKMEKDFKKDYSAKIALKFGFLPQIKDKQQSAQDVNSMIVLLNYCFLKKNNFFIDNFNKNVVKTVWKVYNTIKTNILTNDKLDLFEGVNAQELKSVRFIISNTVNNFNKIMLNNSELCSIISVESLKRCLILIGIIIKRNQEYQAK